MHKEPSIKKVSSREVYRNPWTRVREDVIVRSNGELGVYGVIEKDPAGIIIPLEQTPVGDYLYLVEQYRYTVGGWHKEFPQGGWETAEIVPEELARGELKEETGLTAASMLQLGAVQIAYGVMAQKQYIYLATGLAHGDTERDVEEHDLIVHRVPVAEFERMLLAGEIVDNCTIAAWGLYKLWREKQ